MFVRREIFLCTSKFRSSVHISIKHELALSSTDGLSKKPHNRSDSESCSNRVRISFENALTIKYISAETVGTNEKQKRQRMKKEKEMISTCIAFRAQVVSSLQASLEWQSSTEVLTRVLTLSPAVLRCEV
jgi:hypothetical protein